MLPQSLYYCELNYNKQFNHDIIIFYHGQKYDDVKYRNLIKSINPKTNYIFHKLELKLPDHVKEEDLFYNKTHIPYVKKDFPKSRAGYLYANYFWNNFMNFKQLDDYDQLIRIDDDSWFKKKIDFNIFEKMKQSNKLCGGGYTWNHVHHRVLDTRMNLYNWMGNYVNKYNIDVKSKRLKKCLEEGENDIIDNRKCNKCFHTMKILPGNFMIYNRKMFELPEWKQYNKEINDYAPYFKHRWGDTEIMTLFYYIHIGESFFDLDLKNKGFYSNSLPGTTMVHNALN
jgi:hypothetical protein